VEIYDGKEIAEVGWENGDRAIARDQRLIFRYAYHGDHAENWVEQYKEGILIASYNARYISDIIWKED